MAVLVEGEVERAGLSRRHYPLMPDAARIVFADGIAYRICKPEIARSIESQKERAGIARRLNQYLRLSTTAKARNRILDYTALMGHGTYRKGVDIDIALRLGHKDMAAFIKFDVPGVRAIRLIDSGYLPLDKRR